MFIWTSLLSGGDTLDEGYLLMRGRIGTGCPEPFSVCGIDQ